MLKIDEKFDTNNVMKHFINPDLEFNQIKNKQDLFFTKVDM